MALAFEARPALAALEQLPAAGTVSQPTAFREESDAAAAVALHSPLIGCDGRQAADRLIALGLDLQVV